MNRKKIFFLIPSLEIGGAETVLVNLLTLFDHKKYEVVVCTIVGKGVLINQLPKEAKLIKLTQSVLLYRMANYLYVKYGITVFIKFLTRKLKGHYDAAFCFLDGVFTDYVFLSNLKYDKYYSVVQSSYSTYKQKTKYLKGRHLLKSQKRYEKLNGIIASSQSIKRDFETVFGFNDKVSVIYNPINLERVLEMAEKTPEITIDSSVINIVAMGRLIPIKGYENLLKAAKILKEKSIVFKITIIGTGPLFDELNVFITRLGLENHIVLTGFINNPYPLIKAADIYTMTSFSEGLPTSLIEAEFLGKPIVTTNVSGCNEVINHGEYGVLVEPNPESIAHGLALLILDADLRRKYGELSTIRSKIFDDQKTLESYYNLINT